MPSKEMIFPGAIFPAALAIAVLICGCAGPQEQVPGTATTLQIPVTTQETVTTTLPVSTAAQPAPVSAGARVTIQNFAFDPASVTIARGATITWVNMDSAPHQVVNDAAGSRAEGASFRSGPLARGEQYSFTFTDPGTYPYHCGIHPSMKGTVTVT